MRQTSADDTQAYPGGSAAAPLLAGHPVQRILQDIHRRYGEHIYSTYGYLDAFNRSFDVEIRPPYGRAIPGFGWVAGDYLGIDQGAILAMVENYRSELIWRVMRGNPHLRRGLVRAGFSGGWLSTAR